MDLMLADDDEALLIRYPARHRAHWRSTEKEKQTMMPMTGFIDESQTENTDNVRESVVGSV